MAPDRTSTSNAARAIAKLLKRSGSKVVFAESCTGGLVSGALTAVPGISEYHCGGMVVYRNETKVAYLGIPPRLLEKPGPVSPEVAKQMAQRALEKTPEADLAVSVTGHLGPQAPPGLDGRVFVGIAWRKAVKNKQKRAFTRVVPLVCPRASRLKRQGWVVERVLNLLGGELQAAEQNGKQSATE